MYKNFLALLLLVLAGCNGNSPATNHIEEKEEENAQMTEIKTILFFGNSLTAGYGLDDPSESFPARIKEKIE